MELEALPIRVSDQRVAVSRTISTASMTKLPNGRTKFIVFRRDLARSAPDTVVLRSLAHVMPVLKADYAEASIAAATEELWTIRGTSYEMKVAPIKDHPAMIFIRPAEADFSFPSGRYALVLNAVGYDFTVEGPGTDFAQCTERADELIARNTECGKP